MTTDAKKKKHHRYNTQERTIIAHTLGGSTFFKVGEDEKTLVKVNPLNKADTPVVTDPKLNKPSQISRCVIL